jgi:hypothetical protein
VDFQKSANPDPGWYADPEHAGSERYWDGNMWGEQRRPAQSVIPAQSGSGGGSGFSITALVCGIVGIVTAWIFVGGVLGIIAIVFGILGRKRADADPSGGRRGMATAGLICGIIAVVGTIVWVILIATVIDTSTNNSVFDDIQFCIDHPDALRCN